MDTLELFEIFNEMIDNGNYEIINESRNGNFFNRSYKYKNYILESGGYFAKDSHNQEYEEFEEVYNIKIIK